MNQPIIETVWLFIDIAVVTYLIYRGLLVIRGTRAAPMMMGLTALILFYLASDLFGLVTVHWLLENFLSSIILVIIVIFQDEIRRGLTKMGAQPMLRRSRVKLVDKTIEDLTLVSSRLAESKTGALIVIQREVGLEDFVEESVILDAQLSRKLLTSIFNTQSPLHDGAVLIEGSRIRAAGCVLPLSFDPDLDPNLGTRHRAALGISERSDAIVIIVSEETGTISLARDGRLVRNLDAAALRDSLHRLLSKKSTSVETKEEA